jgi:hypothetical protein
MKIKILTIGIILLFIGVAVAPSINFNVVKASSDNDLIEVTSQACGIKGYGNTTVKLTKEQYQNLEQYLVGFRAKLNHILTREKAIPVYNEAIVELSKYGLLPKGMSVEKARKLIIWPYKNSTIIKHLCTLLQKNSALANNTTTNYFCLLAGNTTNTLAFGPVIHFLNKLTVKAIIFAVNHPNIVKLIAQIIQRFNCLEQLYEFFVVMLIYGVTFFFTPLIAAYNPLSICSTITFGYELPEGSFPSTGWVKAIGLNGETDVTNQFYGTFPMLPIYVIGAFLYPGVVGFTGINIQCKHRNGCFFLGSAFALNISPDVPS